MEREMSARDKEMYRLHLDALKDHTRKTGNLDAILGEIETLRRIGGEETLRFLLSQHFSEDMNLPMALLYMDFSDQDKLMAHELAAAAPKKRRKEFKRQVGERDHNFYEMWLPFKDVCTDWSFKHPKYPQSRGPLGQGMDGITHLRVMDYVAELSVGRRDLNILVSRVYDTRKMEYHGNKREHEITFDIFERTVDMGFPSTPSSFETYEEAAQKIREFMAHCQTVDSEQVLHAIDYFFTGI